MSSAYVLVAFAVCILLMILFISKWKIHPVTSILVATIILAISIGTPWDKIEGIINKGMADTLKSIAIVIVLGCILGKVLEETGAAVSITKATVKLFGEKRVLWAYFERRSSLYRSVRSVGCPVPGRQGTHRGSDAGFASPFRSPEYP